jgi:hypothetical protein
MIARAKSADVSELLGIPWEQQDCAQLAQRALAKCGLAVPAAALGRFGEGGEQELRIFMAGVGGQWAEVGHMPDAAMMLGDVIVMRYGAGNVHLAVLVDETRRLALTTSASSRSAIMRVDRLMAIWRVIRWIP